MSYDLDEDQSNPWLLLIVGVAMFALAWWTHSAFTKMELSGGSLRMPAIAVLLYQIFGKWALVGIFAIVGAVFCRLGWRKLQDA